MNSLLPGFVAEKFQAGVESCDLTASVLCVRISGHGEAVDRLAHEGREGAEALGIFLNRLFAEIFDAVQAGGGFVAECFSNYLLAVFPDHDVASLTDAVADIQRIFQEHGIARTRSGEFSAEPHCGAAYGVANLRIMRGKPAFYAIRGACVDAARTAADLAGAREIVVHVGVRARLVSGASSFEELRTDYFRIRDFASAPRSRVRAALEFIHLNEVAPGLDASQAEFFSAAWLEAPLTLAAVEGVALALALDTPSNADLIKLQSAALRASGVPLQLRFNADSAEWLIIFGWPGSVGRPAAAADEFLREAQALFPDRLRAALEFGQFLCGLVGGARRAAACAIGEAADTATRLLERARAGQAERGFHAAAFLPPRTPGLVELEAEAEELHLRGDYEAMARTAAAALALAGDDSMAQARLQFLAGAAEYQRRDYARSLTYFEAAYLRFREAGAHSDAVRILAYLSCLFARRRQPARALRAALADIRAHAELGADPERGRSRLGAAIALTYREAFGENATDALTRLTRVTGLEPQADAYFEAAIESARSAGYAFTLVPALREYGMHLIQASERVPTLKERGLYLLREAAETARAAGMEGQYARLSEFLRERGTFL